MSNQLFASWLKKMVVINVNQSKWSPSLNIVIFLNQNLQFIEFDFFKWNLVYQGQQYKLCFFHESRPQTWLFFITFMISNKCDHSGVMYKLHSHRKTDGSAQFICKKNGFIFSLTCHHQIFEFVVIDEAAAVCVCVCDHVVDLFLRQVVAEVSEDPAEVGHVDLALLVLVEDAEALL